MALIGPPKELHRNGGKPTTWKSMAAPPRIIENNSMKRKPIQADNSARHKKGNAYHSHKSGAMRVSLGPEDFVSRADPILSAAPEQRPFAS